MTTSIKKKTPQVFASLFLTLFVSNTAAAGPVANPDHVNTSRGEAQTVGVLWNDHGQRLWISDVNQYSEQGGRIYALPDGQKVHYTPKAGFSGTDAFWYAITDAHGRTNSSKVTVSVSGGGHYGAPAKQHKSKHRRAKHRKNYNVQWSQPGFSLNFSKSNGVSAHFGQPSHPKPTHHQPQATTRNWNTRHQGGGPVGHADTYSTHVSSGQSKLYVLTNDQGQGLSVQSTNPWTKNGGQAWVVNDHTGSYIMYTPKPGYRGPDELWYVLRDAHGQTNSSSAHITMW